MCVGGGGHAPGQSSMHCGRRGDGRRGAQAAAEADRAARGGMEGGAGGQCHCSVTDVSKLFENHKIYTRFSPWFMVSMALLYCTVRCGTVLFCSVLYCQLFAELNVWCRTALYQSVPHCTECALYTCCCFPAASGSWVGGPWAGWCQNTTTD